MNVPLVDLLTQYEGLRDEIRAAIDGVCESQRFILGEQVERLERAVASYVGSEYGIGVSSGSDALLCALSASGVVPGDEVITTPFTFFATAGSIARLGAVPRFADVCSDTLNIDPLAIERNLNERTKAIIVVHLFGQPAEMDVICELARRWRLSVVEDAAQALGSAYCTRKAGTWGSFGCYSFFPSKPLGGFGDGGMIVTHDRALADRCRQLRSHGDPNHVSQTRVAGNFRLDALQAAVLSVKLPHLDHWIRARKNHALAYDAAFADLDGVTLLTSRPEAASAHANYTLRVRDGRRGKLAAHLRDREIETRVYYPRPLHLQACFAELGQRRGALPESERAAAEVLSIPLYPELTLSQRDYVIDAIRSFFG